jgi:6-phosphogluconolactonase (cycloisomerase 2 family)
MTKVGKERWSLKELVGERTRALCSLWGTSSTSPTYVNDPISPRTCFNLRGYQYSAGVISKFSISASPPYLLDASPSTTQLKGTGPNPERQESSHPHQVFYHGPRDEILVPDLGADVVRRFKIAKDGSLVHQGDIQQPAGGGPRHVAFHGESPYSWIIVGPKQRYAWTDGDLYTLLELSSVLVKHRFPPLPELPTFVTSTPTMSNPPPSPTDMLAAEILIPPTNAAYPTPYLYLSNRNDPSPGGDTIAIFSISNPDSLDLVTEFKTGLNHVRGMLFGGPDDKWLVAGGAQGGGIRVFERVDGGKNLKLIAENKSIEAPTGFLWV